MKYTKAGNLFRFKRVKTLLALPKIAKLEYYCDLLYLLENVFPLTPTLTQSTISFWT